MCTCLLPQFNYIEVVGCKRVQMLWTCYYPDVLETEIQWTFSSAAPVPFHKNYVCAKTCVRLLRYSCVKTLCNYRLSPYITGMRQMETSSLLVRDYFAAKINDINTTFTLQSH